VVARDGSLGAIVQLTVRDETHGSARPASTREVDVHPLRNQLPGRSIVWRSTLTRAVAGMSDGRLLLRGPIGVGKSWLARALAELDGRSMKELDARVDDVGDALAALRADHERPAGLALTVTHLEVLDARALSMFRTAIEAIGPEANIAVVGTTVTELHQLPADMASCFAHVIDVPPLDKRREDIPDIVATLLRRNAPGLAPLCNADALQDLMRRDWPGNIAQLQRVVQSALARSGGRTIRKADLPAAIRAAEPRRELTPLERAERDAIHAALASADGRRSVAAQLLGVSRSTLYRKMAALGVRV
jgi:DNA-binding NtrC family response regulator